MLGIVLLSADIRSRMGALDYERVTSMFNLKNTIRQTLAECGVPADAPSPVHG
jgi:hypothetical protein